MSQELFPKTSKGLCKQWALGNLTCFLEQLPLRAKKEHIPNRMVERKGLEFEKRQGRKKEKDGGSSGRKGGKEEEKKTK